VLAVLAAAILAAASLRPEARRGASATVAVAAALLVGGIHAAVRPADRAGVQRDEGTNRFLEERYVPRPGHASPAMWETKGGPR
jgi:hypothetical protein